MVEPQLMRVAIDLDNTLIRTHDILGDLMSYATGREIDISEWDSWQYPMEQGLEDEFWRGWDLVDEMGLRRIAEPYDKMVPSSLVRLADDPLLQIDILSCNENKPEIHQAIGEWLGRYLPASYVKHFPSRLLGRKEHTTKLNLHYDIYLDDSPVVARNFEPAHGHLLLANCPWNGDIEEGDNVHRFRSWADVPQLVSALEDEIAAEP